MKALLGSALLHIASAQASYQCAELAGNVTPYWENSFLEARDKPRVFFATPVLGRRPQVEAAFARTNAKVIQEGDLTSIVFVAGGAPGARDINVFCNEPPFILGNGQYLEARCDGLDAYAYHQQFDRWIPQGWTESEHPQVGRVTELVALGEGSIYQMELHQRPQHVGPRVATLRGKKLWILGACAIRPTLVGYFNGVWNTQRDAQEGLKRLKAQFSTERDGIALEYHLFYNQTGCNSGGNKALGCLMDLAETFAQRQKEFEQDLQHRWEYFWDLAAQRDDADDSWLGQLRQRIATTAAPLFATYRRLADAMHARAAELASYLLQVPPTEADAAAHLARLQAAAGADMHAVLVAHSQGNLFANTAYDAFYRLGLQGLFSPPQVKTIHVAPASATVRGEYVLADKDLVIGAIRIAGRQTLAPNITIPLSLGDPSGHQFAETYFDSASAAGQRVKQLIAEALDSL